VDLEKAAEQIDRFYDGKSLTKRIWELEHGIAGIGKAETQLLFSAGGIGTPLLGSALVLKAVAGQINVVIHVLGILVALPHILDEDEVVDYVSLGAGNTGRRFDLETNKRAAEFKLTNWQGGPESIRQNQLFKDFFYLAEYSGGKRRCLYLLGTEHALRFLAGNRALTSVLSKNEALRTEFHSKFGQHYRVVSDYYNDQKHLVEITDLAEVVPGLADIL